MERNYSLDYIRVIAMLGILVDHAICFYGSNSLNYSGIQIGGVALLSSSQSVRYYLAVSGKRVAISHMHPSRS